MISKGETGDTLSTGRYTLTFVEMPMIHWPDNMLTYVAEQKIAFSNDAFGQHIASYDIFDDAHGAAKCIESRKRLLCKYRDAVWYAGCQ